jgi:peptidoglycan/xylan/chitin deacetylase (PgdA/CDA1 family)
VSVQLHSGAIILLHDSAPDNQNQDRSQTVAALPMILAAMRQRGLRAVTLPQLLHDAGISRPAALSAPSPSSSPPTSL